MLCQSEVSYNQIEWFTKDKIAIIETLDISEAAITPGDIDSRLQSQSESESNYESSSE